jgi:hypothetical protein
VVVNDDFRALFALFGVPLFFYYGDFYLVFKALMDTFFILLIIGFIAAAARRAFVKPSLLAQPPTTNCATISRTASAIGCP